MQQQAAALNVPQEIVAQAGALRRALDDAWNIRRHKGLPFAHIDHAQIGNQGGEMVIGDFGAGFGNHRK